MVAAYVLKSIAILIVSFLAGFLFFYVTSSLSKIEKKQQLEETSSQLINFVIYIWLGKIVTNIQVFVQDPLTILAYPSNSAAFYVAALFSMVTIGYKVKKHDFHVAPFLKTFIPVFLVASFVYEFIEIVLSGHSFGWGYLGILAVLIIIYLVLDDRITHEGVVYLLIGWSVGHLILAWCLPFTTVFGYIISPIFFIVLMIVLFVLLIFNRKKVS